MTEFFLSLAVVAVLFAIIYGVSVAAMRVFTISGPAADERKRTARQRFLDAFSKDPRELLLAAELLNSLVFVAITAVVIWSLSRLWQERAWPTLPALIIALLAVWLLRVLLGDVLPKRRAIEPADSSDRSRLAGLALIYWVFRPLLWLAGWITRARVGKRPPAEREEIVERAIDTLAESAGMDEPVIEPDERAMIEGVIGLEGTEVREVMVPRVDIVAVDVHATVEDVRRRTTEFGHSRLPVFDGDLDSIVGILYVKDLFCAQLGGTIDLGALVRRAYVVPETKRVDDLLEEFKRERVHIAIVLDEFGGTAGLVTLEDILEEIVGEIEDEHDLGRRQIEHDTDGSLHADGVVSLDQIAAAFDIELPDERFETIGGLIYDRVGGVPKVGQSFAEHGLAITIEQMDGQRIRRVRIRRAAR
ncbi:MAG: hemolysin family protein [Candidatus Zixiibacteriota bacterium]